MTDTRDLPRLTSGELPQGNRKYVKWLQAQDSLSVQQSQFGAIEQEMSMVTLKECGYLQQIEEERLGLAGGPLRPTRPKALAVPAHVML